MKLDDSTWVQCVQRTKKTELSYAPWSWQQTPCKKCQKMFFFGGTLFARICSGRPHTWGKQRREREIINKSLKKNDGAGLPHINYFVLWSAAARPATAAAATATAAAATTTTFFKGGQIWLTTRLNSAIHKKYTVDKTTFVGCQNHFFLWI